MHITIQVAMIITSETPNKNLILKLNMTPCKALDDMGEMTSISHQTNLVQLD
jgi:hypothetical protein